MQIGTELISYTGVSGNNLTGNPGSKGYGSVTKGYVVPFAGDYSVTLRGIVDVSFCMGGNGGTVKVKSLPTIKADDIIGMPVVGVVGKGRPYTNKNGKEVTPSEVKFVKAWSDGIKKEMNADADIPF